MYAQLGIYSRKKLQPNFPEIPQNFSRKKNVDKSLQGEKSKYFLGFSPKLIDDEIEAIVIQTTLTFTMPCILYIIYACFHYSLLKRINNDKLKFILSSYFSVKKWECLFPQIFDWNLNYWSSIYMPSWTFKNIYISKQDGWNVWEYLKIINVPLNSICTIHLIQL